MRRTISAPARARGFTLVKLPAMSRRERAAFTLVELPAVSKRERAAFTLVELLVVIGIIALLISILLPTLSSARRAAASAKCAAHLREIGTTFQQYAIENKGWYPAAQLVPGSGKVYNFNGVDYTSGSGAGIYWTDFLSKYVTKTKSGISGSGQDSATARRVSLMWGCPSWDGYYTGSVGGLGYNRIQTGYGMTPWPKASAANPLPAMDPYPTNHPDLKERTFVTQWGLPTQIGNFAKQTPYTRQASERGLVADSRFWMTESRPCPPMPGDATRGVFPPQPNAGNYLDTWTTGWDLGQTMADVYRHGKYPGMGSVPKTFSQTGGKVGYNILYADGHVVQHTDQVAAYKAFRMRYPN